MLKAAGDGGGTQHADSRCKDEQEIKTMEGLKEDGMVAMGRWSGKEQTERMEEGGGAILGGYGDVKGRQRPLLPDGENGGKAARGGGCGKGQREGGTYRRPFVSEKKC
jgi:hypothetical protein